MLRISLRAFYLPNPTYFFNLIGCSSFYRVYVMTKAGYPTFSQCGQPSRVPSLSGLDMSQSAVRVTLWVIMGFRSLVTTIWKSGLSQIWSWLCQFQFYKDELVSFFFKTYLFFFISSEFPNFLILLKFAKSYTLQFCFWL